jgi:hypothetical protein
LRGLGERSGLSERMVWCSLGERLSGKTERLEGSLALCLGKRSVWSRLGSLALCLGETEHLVGCSRFVWGKRSIW